MVLWAEVVIVVEVRRKRVEAALEEVEGCLFFIAQVGEIVRYWGAAM